MITTFLWMLYLAFTLFLSVALLKRVTETIFFDTEQEEAKFNTYLSLVVCILWSIWYFYYLH